MNYKEFAKWEFLIDADVEFSRLKFLLNHNPKVLAEDPLVGIDYIKVLQLIKKKKVLERTQEAFDHEKQVEHSYYDI